MKSLIIENERNIPELLQSFIGASPELVGEPYLLNYARSRPLEELVELIGDHDTLLIESTFIYVDQVEKIVDALWNGTFGKKQFIIYLMYVKSKLNNWVKKDPYLGEYSWQAKVGFENHERFVVQLIDLIQLEQIILFETHWTPKTTLRFKHDDPEETDPFIGHEYAREYDWETPRIVFDEESHQFVYQEGTF